MLKIPIFILLVTVQKSYAIPSSPSEESIKEVLITSNTKKIIEDGLVPYRKQYESQIKNTLKDFFNDKKISTVQKNILRKKLPSLLTTARDFFSWKTQEEILVQLYAKSFNKEQIEEIKNFYTSPVGKIYSENLLSISNQAQLIFEQKRLSITNNVTKDLNELIAELNAAQVAATSSKVENKPDTVSNSANKLSQKKAENPNKAKGNEEQGVKE